MAIGAAIASGVMSAANSYSSTKLSNIQSRYSAKTNELNAKLSERQAENALRRGEKEQQQIMTKGAKVKGAQKVAYGANGIDLSSRSAQNVMNETDYFTQADQLQAAANAIGEAWNYRLQSAQYQGQALIDRSNVKNAWKPALMAGLQAGLSTYMMAGGKFGSGTQTEWSQSAGGYVSQGTETGTASFQIGNRFSNPYNWSYQNGYTDLFGNVRR